MNQEIRIGKLQYALKHLSKAAEHVKKRAASKSDLTKKLQKVKASAKKGKDVAIDLDEIEDTLRQVLKNERDMLEQQKRYVELLKKKLEQVSPDFQKELDTIKKDLERNMASENLHAAEYKNKIEELEFGLSEVEKEELDDLRYTKDQIDKVNRGMSELKQRLDIVSPKRINQLEKRIRSDVQANRKQLLLIEQEIRHLERKSKDLKKKGLSKEVITKFEDKITKLKEKSGELIKKYPPSTDFVPKKLDIKVPKKESEWKPPSFKDVKKQIEEDKQAEGVSELQIPAIKKPAQKPMPKKHPPKPLKKSSAGIPDLGELPKLEGENQSLPGDGFPTLEADELPKLKEGGKLPPLEPDLDKKFEMPKEFERPKKLSFIKRMKSWLGL